MGPGKLEKEKTLRLVPGLAQLIPTQQARESQKPQLGLE